MKWSCSVLLKKDEKICLENAALILNIVHSSDSLVHIHLCAIAEGTLALFIVSLECYVLVTFLLWFERICPALTSSYFYPHMWGEGGGGGYSSLSQRFVILITKGRYFREGSLFRTGP